MKKYFVVWTSNALSDLSSCVSFVLKVSKEAARELKNAFSLVSESLAFFPEKNPVFLTPKGFPFILRKQVVNNRYLVLYTVEEDKVVIYRVLDVRRNFQQLL